MVGPILGAYSSTKALLRAAVSALCNQTYDFGNIRLAQQGESRASRFVHSTIEAAIVLAILALLAGVSRSAQYEVMAQQVSTYFLPGLINVSTTNDAGIFLERAREWLSVTHSDPSQREIGPGGLLPYVLATVASSFDTNLEHAGRILVYSGVALTSFATYLMLASIGQSALGLAVGSMLVFIWPFYSRTSIGMIDTDLFNLGFLTLILAIFSFASSRSKPQLILASALAGLLLHTFYLWYGHSGFMLPLVMTYGLLLFFKGRGIGVVVLATLVFVASSGSEVWLSISGSLNSFWSNYLYPLIGSIAPDRVSSTSTSDPSAYIWTTISEISRVNSLVIKNDYGSLVAFVAAQAGLFIWYAHAPSRVLLTIPMLAFLFLYFSVGQRFGFYSSVLFLIGLLTVVMTALKLGMRAIRHLRPQPLVLGDSPHLHVEKVLNAEKAGIQWVQLASIVVLVPMLLSTRTFPSYKSIPPPVVDAAELLDLMRTLAQTEQAILLSWWDYGYELSYRTSQTVSVNPGSPTSMKNVYIARALTSPNPYYASDEFRFAAYFTEEVLREHYPERPPVSLASGTNKDIYVFLPSDLIRKFPTVVKIASGAVESRYLQGYDPRNATFNRLFFERPARFGALELVHSRADGAAIYRIPAPLSK